MKALYQFLPFKLRSSLYKIRERPLLQIYSHPRSGTHFLEAFIGENFFLGENLHIAATEWGHWSNRIMNVNGNKYGKLFGSHSFPNRSIELSYEPMIYIARDARPVAFSLFRTENFSNDRISKLSFSEFLRAELDWIGSPGIRKDRTNLNILEHIILHHNHWYAAAKKNRNILILKYEDLVANPEENYNRINKRFFKDKNTNRMVDKVQRPVGLLPNKGKSGQWQDHFNFEDLQYYNSLEKFDMIYSKI